MREMEAAEEERLKAVESANAERLRASEAKQKVLRSCVLRSLLCVCVCVRLALFCVRRPRFPSCQLAHFLVASFPVSLPLFSPRQIIAARLEEARQAAAVLEEERKQKILERQRQQEERERQKAEEAEAARAEAQRIQVHWDACVLSATLKSDLVVVEAGSCGR